MADLKPSSTVGGSPIWTQGNFPLNTAGDSILYKSFKVYTEKDKPQAVDNDFVSKADGGEYLKRITVNDRIIIKSGAPIITFQETDTSKIYNLVVDGSNIRLNEDDTGNATRVFQWTASSKRFDIFGTLYTNGVYDTGKRVYSDTNPPTPSQVGLSNVINERQVKLSGDTMTGLLTAPQMASTSSATRPEHVPRFDQIVIKDSIQDFGYYS